MGGRVFGYSLVRAHYSSHRFMSTTGNQLTHAFYNVQGDRVEARIGVLRGFGVPTVRKN